MLDILFEVEQKLELLIQGNQLHSLFIDYHEPYVKRIWFQYGEYRVYLHKIYPCGEGIESLYHPHPWQSAIRILQGKYEMGVGHSTTKV